jgi:hypothetical protein
VQDAPEWLGREPHIFQSPIEAGDRTAVHLIVQAVAAVCPNNRCFVTIGIGVRGGPTEGLRPVRGQSLGVSRMESVAESVADDFVGHHAGVPRLSQEEQTPASANRLIHALHG